jgi:hypothetical protein
VGVDAQPGQLVNGRRLISRLACTVAVCALQVGGAGEAQANDKAACIAAHGDGQELRLHGRWRDAEARFRTCSSACPGPITQDCARWYDEVRAKMPTIVVAAVGPDGADTVDVTLLVDGTHVADQLPSTAFEVDPGEHVVRLQHAGWPAVEQKVVVREGEKEKRIALSFAPTTPAKGGDATPGPAPAASSPPILGYVLLGVGVVAAGVSIPLAIDAKIKEDNLRNDPCGHNGTCETSKVNPINTEYLVAGIVGGVGLVALGLGIWQVLAHPKADAHIGFGPGGLRLTF